MFQLFKKYFSGSSLQNYEVIIDRVNEKESELEPLLDEELKARSLALRERVQKKEENEEGAVIEAFALVREAAKRTLGQRPFDTQLIGGLVLHQGAVAEMMTGEGKTLAAVAPAYVNALFGEGVHVVTVNEYLARRDAVWMGQIYHALGLTVSCLVPNAAFAYDPTWRIPETGAVMADAARDETGSFLVQQEYLRPIGRREAYQTDIVYGTNHEFGFDYLRDNLAYRLQDRVQRGHAYAIIDEVDSILIDEARTPLIISAPDAQASDSYKTFARVAERLKAEEDYMVDEKHRSVAITEAGIEKVEKFVGIQNIYAPEHIRLVHYLEESLKARAVFRRDKDYVVKNGEVIIIDEFTGRMLQGRRYSAGLHQAIEAKEGVFVKEESRTYAKISIQNYFRMYTKIAGMTGTAQTSAEEFHKVYSLEVISIPSNKPLAREDVPDAIYKDTAAKWRAVVEEVKNRNKNGQPILLGTTSIEKNERLSTLLTQAGVRHEILNAKNNEREGAIIAQAGKLGAVTVATNMAGRGVDILLGGNPPDPQEAEKVRALGGLAVIGTERHEARRIDNQLRGRAGRQGDPGVSKFFLCLDDDLLRIFGGDRIKGLMERFNLPEDQPIDVAFVSRAVAQAQSKVEGANFDLRKHLLEYDDVLNKQRIAVYKRRVEVLGTLEKEKLGHLISEAANTHLTPLLKEPEYQEESQTEALDIKKLFEEAGIVGKGFAWPSETNEETYQQLIGEASKMAVDDPQIVGKILGIIDLLWLNHLEDLDALGESVGLRAYGQKDPLVEYRRESHRLFQEFWVNFNAWIFTNLFKMTRAVAAAEKSVALGTASQPTLKINIPEGQSTNSQKETVGRNDLCPCGSGKKYKKCHGK